MLKQYPDILRSKTLQVQEERQSDTKVHNPLI